MNQTKRIDNGRLFCYDYNNKEGKKMIEFQHVTKRYGKNSEPSVKDLCLTVDAGCVFGFLGPNGAQIKYKNK